MLCSRCRARSVSPRWSPWERPRSSRRGSRAVRSRSSPPSTALTAPRSVSETTRPPAKRRLAAVLALVAYVATLGAILYVLFDDFPALLGAWATALVAVVAGFYSVTRRRVLRIVAALLTVVMVVLTA